MKNSIINEFNEHIKTANLIYDLTDAVDTSAQLCIDCLKNGGKILIFGNGGSAAIASHFSVDLTKNAKIKCLNFNEASLITCLANDYGFEHWAEKAIEFSKLSDISVPSLVRWSK